MKRSGILVRTVLAANLLVGCTAPKSERPAALSPSVDQTGTTPDPVFDRTLGAEMRREYNATRAACTQPATPADRAICAYLQKLHDRWTAVSQPNR